MKGSGFRLDHISLIVKDIEKAIETYTGILGIDRDEAILFPFSEDGDEMKLALVPAGEDTWIELIEPVTPGSPMARFLEARGEAIHHFGINIPGSKFNDIFRHLKDNGVKWVDEEPRPDDKGVIYSFIHPDSAHGALIEVVCKYNISKDGWELAPD